MPSAAYQRDYRRRRRANGGQRLTRKAEPPGLFDKAARVQASPPLDDPAAALERWAREVLIIPPGHPKAGAPMIIPGFGIAFIRDALKHRESLLCIGRKNAKSAIVAAYLLCRLVGPLAFDGYRAGVLSVSREKAAELWLQADGIATASNLQGLVFKKAPKKIEGPNGSVDILSADASAGHSSGFDDAIIDELGLLKERDRTTVNGMRSAVSARDGRFWALSILGNAPFTKEIIERRANQSTAVHLYASEPGCAIDDPAAWADSNPGIACGIKSEKYMADEAERVRTNPADERSFRAFDLNQPVDAMSESLITLDTWRQHVYCEPENLPPRAGRCWLALDIGGSVSMTCAVAYWESKRLEVFGAFPDAPDLIERGKADGVGSLYLDMQKAGELQTFPGRATPVKPFLEYVIGQLGGQDVRGCIADRYRRGDVEDSSARIFKLHFSALGMGKDGTAAVVAFQRMAVAGQLQSNSLMLKSAIAESAVQYDRNGNAALDKSRTRGRIDAASAAILVCKLASEELEKKGPSFKFVSIK